jgi:hypothetical protein
VTKHYRLRLGQLKFVFALGNTSGIPHKPANLYLIKSQFNSTSFSTMWNSTRRPPRSKKTVKLVISKRHVVLVVSFSLLSMWVFWRIIGYTDPQIEYQNKYGQVLGYYQAEKSSSIVPYWWCKGTDYFQDEMNKHRTQIFRPPFTDHQIVYYAQSATKGLKRILSKQYPNYLSMDIIQVEKWQDYATGIHGFVDFQVKYDESRKENFTMEFDDNEATAMDVYLNEFSQKSKVWFITTTYKRPDHFQRYLNSLGALYDNKKTNFGVCLGIFGDKDVPTQEEEALKVFKEKYSNIEFHIVKKDLPFKKAPSLQECINSPAISPDDIVFMTDVDVTFEPSILDRLYRYVAQGKRAFDPIIWYRDRDEISRTYKKNPTGYAYGGIGIMALYKSDVNRFGGYDVETFQDQHGFEDTDFFFRVKYIKLQIARTLEKQLQHWPHARDTWQQSAERDVSKLCPSVE